MSWSGAGSHQLELIISGKVFDDLLPTRWLQVRRSWADN